MAHPLYEVEEEILKRLDVKDLLRCKSVCKSWSSLISNQRFIKIHLEHHYANDCDNERIGHRRITMSKEADYISNQHFEFDHGFFELNDSHLLGSCNGLVCVSPSPSKILVINPSTREVKKVRKPRIPETDFLCWGFGYDSLTNDYKLVLGYKKDENHTCFQVFSLRSNMWKVIGEINYGFTSRVGILCKGALHWLAYAFDISSNVIVSFHFLEEKFLEFPMPHDVRYRELVTWKPFLMRLGNMNECLCLFPDVFLHDVWSGVSRNTNIRGKSCVSSFSQQIAEKKNGHEDHQESKDSLCNYDMYSNYVDKRVNFKTTAGAVSRQINRQN
ncbi:F-box/kelch-repeat protein At3g06240 [Helianthus annuus]|uniref:F-box/kelch-repeat protein At3g06240 n=1 Tax=Helianthus annuus TaxID=4232 RepID=UPI000B909A2E|nr:F-box/kelch-repeat protein At3g06240 [Helianthus annuus]